jgi:hypothetical protein
MTLDINHELFPCHVGEQLSMVLATTLSLDGTKEETSWRSVSRSSTTTLADMYDYVCYGKNYRFEDGDGDTLYVHSLGNPCFHPLTLPQQVLCQLRRPAALHRGPLQEADWPQNRQHLHAAETLVAHHLHAAEALGHNTTSTCY